MDTLSLIVAIVVTAIVGLIALVVVFRMWTGKIDLSTWVRGLPLSVLALAQIVVGGARQRAGRAGEGLRLLALELHDDAAVGAHLHQPHPILALKHRVLAGELCDDPLDRALDPE